MGWGYGQVAGRDVGYGVLATCDKRGCDNEIDRGMAYICGDFPHRWFDDEPGCGMYYCAEHLTGVGPKGGCSHRQRKPYGRVLSCMVVDAATNSVCLFRAGHEPPHAWDVDEA